MEDPIASILTQQGFVVVDGGLATELERLGANINDSLWSAKLLIENPSLIKQVHKNYLMAGADVIITASYQAAIDGFIQKGVSSEEASALLTLSTTLAKEAREEFWADPQNREGRIYPLIAASIGPYGATLHDGSEYRGDYKLSEEELIAFHLPRIKHLLATEPDLLACETIPCLAEAKALIKLFRENKLTNRESRVVPLWLTFSCCNERHCCHGEDFVDCVALASEWEGVVAVGINCTAPIHVEGLLKNAAAGVPNHKPFIVYPNSGEIYRPSDGGWDKNEEQENLALLLKKWHEAGASIIGGCCRTTPDTIRQIRKYLEESARLKHH